MIQEAKAESLRRGLAGTIVFDDDVDEAWHPLIALFGCLMANTPLDVQGSYSYNFDDDATYIDYMADFGFTTSKTCLDASRTMVSDGCPTIFDGDDGDDDGDTDICTDLATFQATASECSALFGATPACEDATLTFHTCLFECINTGMGCGLTICDATTALSGTTRLAPGVAVVGGLLAALAAMMI